ncbi:hypothetical protein CASFOL_004069 [Castilleja foliolosa]|uniref:Aluminum-activated malate transporter n=1 Tax=Castilleja foliolosa TaxID=1961234 RepID=A0ABD3EJ14_9LAMI
MSKDNLLPIYGLDEINDDEITCFKSMSRRFTTSWHDFSDFSKKALDMGRKDPRKIIYAMKMGLALALVSLLLFWKSPNDDVSQYSIWAILTVVVMFEFSIGATFIKGFNRGFGTVCAGMLAFFFAELTVLAGDYDKFVICISFFITGFCASYLRLYPTMAPYDYGYRVFVLTFCILMVAGNRTSQYTIAILTRLVLIAVGACICFVVNIFIYPIWSGDDLHRLVVNNFQELANSLEGCVDGYLKYVDYDRASSRFLSQTNSDEHYIGYKTVIESASREKTLLGFAVWEPPYGRFKKINWKTFVKMSGSVRHCAYTVMALHGCILSEIQAPPEKRAVFRSQLQSVSVKGAKILRTLGHKIDKMEKLSKSESILKEVHAAGEQLQKKIDQKSYILVNSESWEIGNYTKELDHPIERDQQETMNVCLKSLSETSIYARLPNQDSPKAQRLLRRQVTNWPSWVSFEGDNGLTKDDEVRTYESASALSLATFASLLIEFVARLQNVVDCFEEVCEEARFSDCDDDDSDAFTEIVGFWTRFLRFKN